MNREKEEVNPRCLSATGVWRRHPDAQFGFAELYYRNSDSGMLSPSGKKAPLSGCFFLEAPPGIGPGNEGFADLCLTAWLWRHIFIILYYAAAYSATIFCALCFVLLSFVLLSFVLLPFVLLPFVL